MNHISANEMVLFMENQITFTLFADLHYKKRMYASTVPDMEQIIERAHSSNSDFIIHAGDLCNDYKGSEELMKLCLKNKYELPFYGVYGNHELEGKDNSMKLVTPLLTNREVVFGDNDVGYYYFDKNGFRFICLDTNYSLLDGEWVHNLTCSYGPPTGSIHTNSLGSTQLKWLEAVLFDALNNGLKCITISHAEFSGQIGRDPSGDALAVRELFKKVNSKKKTVIMAINGHYHSDHINLLDGIVYLDCNTVRNGFWSPAKEHHYSPDMTFDFTDYDCEGIPTESQKLPLCELSQAKNTWFFTKPLSAVIRLSDSFIEIEGSNTEWMYGIPNPETDITGVRTSISSARLEI